MCLGTMGTIIRTWDEGGVPMAAIDTERGEQAVCLLYHPDVGIGADVLVHMGFVIESLDATMAAEARAARRELAEAAGGDARPTHT